MSPEAAPSPTAPEEAPPRPDAPVGPIVISYDAPPSVSGDDLAISVPKGATSLSFAVALNASSAGPYSVTGAVCLCDPSLNLFRPGGKLAWSQTWGEINEAPIAGNATGPTTIEGPFRGIITSPEAGTWKLQLWGSGKNMEADLAGTITFG